MASRKIISILFNPLSYYPPTINALQHLAQTKQFNIFSISTGKFDLELNLPVPIIIKSIQKSNYFKGKLGSFLHFAKFLLNSVIAIRKLKPDFILLYDDYSLLVFFIYNKLFSFKGVLWYHNHDIATASESRFSLNYWAIIANKSLMKKIDIFTYPSIERMPHYNLNEFYGKKYFLPNYPSKIIFKNTNYKKNQNSKKLSLIYQGRVSDGHGLLEIIKSLQYRHNIDLTIIGEQEPKFVIALKNCIKELNLESRVYLIPPIGSYLDLVEFAKSYDVGIAINVPQSVHYSTAATASNKIYEYPAMGMPILYYDNKHYNKYLSKYKWAFPTDLTIENILNILDVCIDQKKELGELAFREFNESLNFGVAFSEFLNEI